MLSSRTSPGPPAIATPDEAPAERHIVVLRPGTDVADAAHDLLAPRGLEPGRAFTHALDGFTVTLSSPAATALEQHPLVAYVEVDREVSVAAQTLPEGIDRVDADVAASIGSGGAVDVDIAIIDTGIDDHADLNLYRHVDCQSGLFGGGLGLFVGSQANCEEGGSDDDGHGTHVAGTAAAIDDDSDVVGVAPGARLRGVKVLGGSPADSPAAPARATTTSSRPTPTTATVATRCCRPCCRRSRPRTARAGSPPVCPASRLDLDGC